MGRATSAPDATFDMFDEARLPLGPGAVRLRGFALDNEAAIHRDILGVVAAAPFRDMYTPSGMRMSVRMTNCGPLGWYTDRSGYRYSSVDPSTDKRWPAMPESLKELAVTAAEAGGYADFQPDACLINCYTPGAQLSLHQDHDEKDFTQPIVSVSLGLPATFLFGGLKRQDKTMAVLLQHGDVVVWGGPSRKFFHGVQTLAKGDHPLLGDCRINLTFRKAS